SQGCQPLARRPWRQPKGRRMRRLVVCVPFLFVPPVLASGDEITPEGKKLAAAYDAMNVENLWLPKRYVNWKTGEALDKEVTDGKAHTHCSAFAAAACMRLDVYLLRPPEHSTVLLANAQYDWLHGEGKKQ